MAATRFGLTGALLLARVGDAAGAKLAIEEAAAAEVFSPIAAGFWLELSTLGLAPTERLGALDRAIACAPGLESARWARFESRVERGDERGALADAESLEAGSGSARQRHGVLTRAAAALVARGLSRPAGQLFERALRYVPDDPVATAGLGRALLHTGKPERAMALFERAIELAEAGGEVAADALIDLAQLLAESGDQPQAIARVSQVPVSSPRGLEALALDGRYRAAIGDLRGASLAFARLRDACELSPDGSRLPQAASWLTEAAQFENRSIGDLAAAERHLASALRLAPRDAKVRRLYREAAAALAKRTRRE
jgi:cellulose synthase operon protein C